MLERVARAICLQAFGYRTPRDSDYDIAEAALDALKPGDYIGDGNWVNTVSDCRKERKESAEDMRERAASRIDHLDPELAEMIRALPLEEEDE